MNLKQWFQITTQTTIINDEKTKEFWEIIEYNLSSLNVLYELEDADRLLKGWWLEKKYDIIKLMEMKKMLLEIDISSIGQDNEIIDNVSYQDGKLDTNVGYQGFGSQGEYQNTNSSNNSLNLGKQSKNKNNKLKNLKDFLEVDINKKQTELLESFTIRFLQTLYYMD